MRRLKIYKLDSNLKKDKLLYNKICSCYVYYIEENEYIKEKLEQFCTDPDFNRFYIEINENGNYIDSGKFSLITVRR